MSGNYSPYLENERIYFQDSCKRRGHAVAQLVEALRYMPEGRGFDSRLT